MSAIQQPKLHRFSLEQYYELGELGLLDQRTELLEGIITDMEPIGPYHANVGDHLSQIFQQQAGGIPSTRPVPDQPGPPKPATA